MIALHATVLERGVLYEKYDEDALQMAALIILKVFNCSDLP